MRWVAVSSSVCLWMLTTAVAAAPLPVETEFDYQLFRPSPGGTSFFTTESGEVNKSFDFSVGLNFNYANNPLRVEQRTIDGLSESLGSIVKSRLDTNLLLSLGLFNIADIGLVMPFIYQGGFDAEAFKAANVALQYNEPVTFKQGDIRLVPKIRFLNLGKGLFSAAIVGTVILPSAQGTPYAGEAGPVYAPALALSTRTESFRMGLNVGYLFRERQQLLRITIDDEIFASLAMGFMLKRGGRHSIPIELIGEVMGKTPANNALAVKSNKKEREYQKALTTIEGDIGVRVGVLDGFSVTVGGGGGITSGIGAPQPRVFATAMFYSGDMIELDTDGDGIPDSSDQCPYEPEDIDGFRDDDGCPDLDNDDDNILDEDDMCPNEAEDIDYWKDEDGCPEPDNDGDFISDYPKLVDRCPNEPEDYDGFEDDDGCPDYDNDKDGIPDTHDLCPYEAEDRDGWRDWDGCPEPDNDGDGLNDLGDMCPDEPEDYDGFEDDDGCPDYDNDKDGIPDTYDLCPNEPESYNGIDPVDGCPKARRVKSLVEVTAEKITIKETIFFKSGSADILEKSFGLLNQVAAVLNAYKHITKVSIEGHTDSVGNAAKNIKLSKDRAASVRNYLIEKGVDGNRLVSEGFGPNQPIASNKTAAGRERNRRVEFVILEQQALGQSGSEQYKSQPKSSVEEPEIDLPGFGGDDAGAPPPAPALTPDPVMDINMDGDDSPAAGKKGKNQQKGKKKGQSHESDIEFN